MEGPRVLYRLGAAGLLALLLAGAWPTTEAAVVACTPDEGMAAATDASGDVDEDPDGVPGTLTGFPRLDLTDICITETAELVLVIATVAQQPDSDNVQAYHWTFRYKPGANGTAQEVRYSSVHGTEYASPAGSAEHDQTRIQFQIPKTVAPPGTSLVDMKLNSTGRYVDATGGVVTGRDNAPDSAFYTFAYKVGQRAPPGTDTDGDGLDDSEEVALNTDPRNPDSDGDGLTDGAEVKTHRTDPRRPDSDADGLRDGEEVRGEATIGGRSVAFAPTDPSIADTDGDGLTDGEEVTGARNQAYAGREAIAGQPGSTDPTKADTDGDGLTDGMEVNGEVLVGTERRTFNPTDPNNPDTDADGLTDGAEVRGLHVSPSGQRLEFPHTSPVQRDTDGDSFDDLTEVRDGFDPTDPNSHPTENPVGDLALYLPISAAFLLVVVLIGLGGIYWRWA